eukprot:349588-Chlamydomonas_euryale.AAC.4
MCNYPLVAGDQTARPAYIGPTRCRRAASPTRARAFSGPSVFWSAPASPLRASVGACAPPFPHRQPTLRRRTSFSLFWRFRSSPESDSDAEELLLEVSSRRRRFLSFELLCFLSLLLRLSLLDFASFLELPMAAATRAGKSPNMWQ